MSVSDEDGQEHLVSTLKASEGNLEETFFVHFGGEVLEGVKTGRAAIVMIAGNWSEMLKSFDSAINKAVGTTTVPLMVDGDTPEKVFTAAVARVCGEAVDQGWFEKPDHLAMALLHTPEVQYLLKLNEAKTEKKD